MATISRSTKIAGGTVLVANTLARAADVETDVLTLFNAHNNHDAGTSKWTVVSAEGASSVPLVSNNSSGTQDILQCKDNGTSVLTVADGGTTTLTCTHASNKTLVVNNGTSTGNVLELQDNGTARFAVADGGNTTLTGGNLTFATSGKGIVGTVAADNAAAGNVGERVNSAQTSFQNTGATTEWANVTSIALTAGDWDVSGWVEFNLNGATATTMAMALSQFSANTTTDHSAGDNSTDNMVATTGVNIGAIPVWRVNVSSSTTVYLKQKWAYTAGTPTAKGRITAIRIR